MSRDERKKASDVFKETTPFFGTKASFDEAFPQIEDVTVEVKESGHGFSSMSHTSVYSKKYLGEYINCSNSLCYNGGFSIGRKLREMVSAGKTEAEFYEFCQGYEGSPKGRRRYRSCTNSFEIKVKIKYKGE